jgi:release factor glutamine methyltransferase
MADVWTIKKLREWTTQFLAKKGVEKAGLDADLLLAHALGCKRIDLLTRCDEEAPEEARTRYRELVKERSEGCPVAYLTGHKVFYLLDLEVSRAVLIPRPETEEIVGECLRLAKGMESPAILDVGTGSGCLILALLKQHKSARATAIDISPEALAIADRNASRHNLGDRITFLEGDLFSPLTAGEQFDFIVSNPPYVAHDEFAGLPRHVRDFEPRLALDGGPDGLAIFTRLIDGARNYLKPGGHLLVEIGAGQDDLARARLHALPGYELGKSIQDRAGIPRVVCARWKP